MATRESMSSVGLPGKSGLVPKHGDQKVRIHGASQGVALDPIASQGPKTFYLLSGFRPFSDGRVAKILCKSDDRLRL